MMTVTFLLAAAAAGAASIAGAAAQSMPGMDMPMPRHHADAQASPAPQPAPATPNPSPAPTATPHAGHAMSADHAGMTMPMADQPVAGHPMSGMAHSQMAMGDARAAYGSGTALLPKASGEMSGLHLMAGDWMLMAHGYELASYTDQAGPRGADKGFAQSMAMLTAQRALSDSARLTLRGMLSLDPLMGRRGYPNLLATGESAFGVPLIDRQHPHDFFMELSARIDLDVAPGTTLFLYGGPAAEPALGPSAFMHRPSARYLPLAPIAHHWFDSTHVTFSVATLGVRHGTVQLEGSAFRGQEPDENRWDIEAQRFDSWSLRASWTPNEHWAAQISHGRIESPEVQHPGGNEARTTASLAYGDTRFAATLAYAAKHRIGGDTLNAWLVEANWDVMPQVSVFSRAEVVENDELVAAGDPRHDTAYRTARFEGGAAYRIALGGPAELALGASALATAVPRALAPDYGKGTGYTLFAKLSLGR